MSEKQKLSKYVDNDEWRPGGRAGIKLRASEAGVLLRPVYRPRLLGWHQATVLADIIVRTADEAKKRGAPTNV